MTDLLSIARFTVDFGLVILIWITQLIVYPSFHVIDPIKFIQWHKQYTDRIGYIAGPLMLLQVVLITIQCFTLGGPLPAVSGGLVAASWYITFRHAVPIHGQLSANGYSNELVDELIRMNRLRTILWMAVFILSCVDIEF
jgi:hypothetical protein